MGEKRRRDGETGRPGRGCKTMYEQQTQIERERERRRKKGGKVRGDMETQTISDTD